MKRSPRLGSTGRPSKELWYALGHWQGAVLRMPSVDPVTTELVRLRCADYHDCGL
jgi:hypothetical protein